MKKVRIDSWNRRQYGSTTSKQRVGHIGATDYLPPSQLVQQHGEGSAIQQPQQANLLLYRRGAQRQRDELNISISAAPNAGLHPFQPTMPRITSTRHPRTTSDSRQAATPTPPVPSTGKPLSDGVKYLRPLPSRPPTSKAASSTHDPLPPIPGASTALLDCLSDSTMTQSDNGTEGDSQDSEENLSDTEYGEEVVEDDEEVSALSQEQLHHKERKLLLSEVEIPLLLGPEQPFPATIIQEHALLDTERYAAGVHPSGLSGRVDNIVRGFQVRGLLNKDILSRALDAVARLHPMLTVQFHRKNNRLYVQCHPEEAFVQLESPTFSGEKPQDAIVIARRKLFQLPIQEIATSSEDELEHERVSKGMSSLGVCDTQATVSFEREAAVAPSTAVRSDWQQRGEDTLMRLPQLSRPSWRDSEKYSQTTSGMEQKSTLSMGSNFTTLLHAKLLSKSPQEHYLILSFPRIVADYWSSALFAQQLSDAYTQLEKVSGPGLTHSRPGANKRTGPGHRAVRTGQPGTTIHCGVGRGAVGGAYGRLGNTLGRGAVVGGGGASRFPRLSSARTKSGKRPASMIHVRFPPQMHFKQIADREAQHLQSVPREGLWAFWESMVTAVIKRQRGPPRVKVVPPARLQSKLGDGRQVKKSRPKTSRLRPATARFIASKDQEGSAAHDNLAGPTSAFHFIRVEDEVCAALKASSPDSSISNIPAQRLMKIFCLSAFTVMLGRCCRGWGKDEMVANQLRGQADGCSGSLLPQEGSSAKVPTVTQLVRGITQQPVEGLIQCRPKTAHRSMAGGKLDLGSFLIGVEISARDLDPERMAGVFGPLTNDVGIRVNLSSCETFADLMVAIERQLQISAQHAHFPFKTIIEEIGILNGVPIKFSFLHDYDIAQLTNPEAFYFTETAVGVEGQALARMGSCYLQPLNGKLNDNCYFELIMWESSDGYSLAGGLRYHTSVIRQELVKQFGEELLRVMAIVADNVEYDLRTLASLIRSPFHKRKV